MKFQGMNKHEANRKSQVNMFRAMLSESKVTWDQSTHAIALKHYRENLHRMIRLAKQNGVKVILLNPASNTSDFAPVRSLPHDRLSGADVERLKGFVKEGRQALELKNPELGP